MDITQWWNWFASQNLAVQALVTIGILNIVVSGLRAAGWTYAADICQKIEDAIKAMLDATKTQMFGAKKLKVSVPPPPGT